MSIVDEKFRRTRLDQSPYLFHFTKGSPQDAKMALYNILQESTLKSKNGYISFTASPITSLAEFFKTPINRTGLPLYQSYGIGFSRDIMVAIYEARNVIYSSSEELKSIPENLRWRTERLDIGVYDFEYLREWRIKGDFDFSSFPKEHIIVIAPTQQDLNDLVIGHDVVFTPFIDHYNGEIDPDWDEFFPREWRGLALTEVFNNYKNDYLVSGATETQIIGEDMFDSLLNEFTLYGTITK